MPDYKEMYFKLFAAVADAVEAIDVLNYGQAKEFLVAAQQNGEERYISAE